ncbi:hypothetical protein BDV98DRAFT_576003 [Pterulicium gracile]|uniref:Uncharacterized protein n=1 Tax=Pterulicium gracile TaxID=1884261 RepID=A0A5C3QDE5_9AGAR|nr:hypothetical protein BDV98DRAFT_576003 [Pterula gracilis]
MAIENNNGVNAITSPDLDWRPENTYSGSMRVAKARSGSRLYNPYRRPTPSPLQRSSSVASPAHLRPTSERSESFSSLARGPASALPTPSPTDVWSTNRHLLTLLTDSRRHNEVLTTRIDTLRAELDIVRETEREMAEMQRGMEEMREQIELERSTRAGENMARRDERESFLHELKEAGVAEGSLTVRGKGKGDRKLRRERVVILTSRGRA